jgi:hypothetical protein
MKPKLSIKFLIYALVLVLSLIIFILFLISPQEFTAAKSVYQAF